MRTENIQRLTDSLDVEKILFELPPLNPRLDVISDYIQTIGKDVNLGNVLPDYVMIIEMFRRKWRGG